MQTQSVCHDTLPRLISFSLGEERVYATKDDGLRYSSRNRIGAARRRAKLSPWRANGQGMRPSLSLSRYTSQPRLTHSWFVSAWSSARQLLAHDPNVFYVMDHYISYPSILVRLDRIDAKALRQLLEMGWRFVTSRAKVRRGTKRYELVT
jgi:hypothetical protein